MERERAGGQRVDEGAFEVQAEDVGGGGRARHRGCGVPDRAREDALGGADHAHALEMGDAAFDDVEATGDPVAPVARGQEQQAFKGSHASSIGWLWLRCNRGLGFKGRGSMGDRPAAGPVWRGKRR